MDSERPQNLRDPGEVKLGNTMLEGEGFRKKLVQFVKVVAVQPNDRRFFQHFHRFHRRATVRHIVNGRNEIALRHEPGTCFLSKGVLINAPHQARMNEKNAIEGVAFGQEQVARIESANVEALVQLLAGHLT